MRGKGAAAAEQARQAEASMRPPRLCGGKYRNGVNISATVRCFNEAPAIMRGKARAGTAATSGGRSSFNEAPAIMRGKVALPQRRLLQ